MRVRAAVAEVPRRGRMEQRGQHDAAVEIGIAGEGRRTVTPG